LQRANEFNELFFQSGILRLEWLVHEQYRRLVRECTGNGDSLSLSSGKIRGKFIRASFESDFCKVFPRPFFFLAL
jgi:hypothetical protein